MIRILKENNFDGEKKYIEAAGLSTDTKPTGGIITGSCFIEVDTGIRYLFDEVDRTWIKQNTGNGKTSIAGATVTLGASLVYTGSEQEQVVSSVIIDETTLTANTDYNVFRNKAIEAGSYLLYIIGKGDYTGTVPVAYSIAKAQSSVGIVPDTVAIYRDQGITGSATLTVVGGGAVSVQSSDSSVATGAISGNTLTVTAVADGEATITVNVAGTDNWLSSSSTLSVSVQAETPKSEHIYGVSWDKSSSTSLTRTDDAANFSAPVPAVSGGNGSSPFDECMPWSGMARETVDGNEMVKIPKFWYKWTNEEGALKLQISDSEAEGFLTSPAHADRGDGKGERDYVYIGRYHCNNNYGSTTGAPPKSGITRAEARTGCAGIGSGYSQIDYAMWWTVRMLYLVEFANWNSQAMIGYGCGDNSGSSNCGASDSMTYHTGTMQANRTSYGVGVQYRYIEDPWGNLYDWCDGIVLSNRAAYVTNVIANYSDDINNHTKVSDGTSANGVISGWDVPATSGLEWAMYPNASISSADYSTYAADGVSSGDNSVVISVGGSYFQNQLAGLFFSSGGAVSFSFFAIGARLQKLP